MANSIIAIPRNGESEIYPSLASAAREFRLSSRALAVLIDNGSEIEVDGNYYCFDFALDEEPSEIPEKKAKYPVKYELTSVKSDRIYKFSSYVDMSNFCGRSVYYIQKMLEENKPMFTDRYGDAYKLRVIA